MNSCSTDQRTMMIELGKISFLQNVFSMSSLRSPEKVYRSMCIYLYICLYINIYECVFMYVYVACLDFRTVFHSLQPSS